MDYGAISYYISAGDFTPLDSFFAEVGRKISLLEHQTDTTLALYEREKAESHGKMKAAFDADMAVASKRYEKAYEEISGSDEIKHSYADHESGWGHHTGRYAMETEQLDLRFAEMADNLHKSAIISIYILLEAELKRLCYSWRALSGHKIALTDFGYRDYLGASLKYLDLVMDLDMNVIEPFQNKLTDLQNLRNRLIHDAGAIAADQLKSVKKLIDSSDGGLICQKTDEEYQLQIVDVAYVRSWYQVLREFFGELFWLTDVRMNNRFLYARLNYLFGVMNPHISIEGLKVSRAGGRRELEFIVDSADFEHLYDFKVKMALKNSPADSLTITNHVARNEQVNRLVTLLDENQHLFWGRAFSGFFLGAKGSAVHFTFNS